MPLMDGFDVLAYVRKESSLKKLPVVVLSASQIEEDIRKAIEVAPQNPAGYVQTGNLRLLQKQYGDAEKYYQQALERDPNSSEGLSGLMNAYLAQKQTDKAVAAANAQLAKVPNSSAFHDLLGTILFNNKKDIKGAEKELRKAAELDKNNSDALLKLGQVQVAQGSVDQAIATYQHALAIRPDFPDAHYNFANALLDAQRADEAISHFRVAL